MGNAELWSGYTNDFNVYTSGSSSVIPQVGDLAVWDRQHIGVVTRVVSDPLTNVYFISVTQANTPSIETSYKLSKSGNSYIIGGDDPFNHWLRRK
jgi:hypothetical protein